MEFIDLKAQYAHLKDKIDKNIEKVLNDSHYIMGEEVKELEEKLAKYVGRKYCVTCGNGTDALTLAMRVLDVKRRRCSICTNIYILFFSRSNIIRRCNTNICRC